MFGDLVTEMSGWRLCISVGALLKLMGGLLGVMSEWKAGVVFQIVGGAGGVGVYVALEALAE